MNTNTSFIRFASLPACFVLLGLLSTAQATTDTWTGANGANWTATSPNSFSPGDPVANDSLIYSGATAGASSVDNETAGFTLASITFNSGAQAYTISGTALVAGNVTNNSAVTQTLSNADWVTVSETYSNTAGGTLAFNSFLAEFSSGNANLGYTGTGNFSIGTFSDVSSFNGGLTATFSNTGNDAVTTSVYSATGGMTLNFNNTGTNTISAAIGGGTGSTGNFTDALTFAGANNDTLSGNIITGNDTSGNGVVNLTFGNTFSSLNYYPTVASPVAYTGTTTITGTNDFNGTITINSGTVIATANGDLGGAVLPTTIGGTYNGSNLTLNGGTLDLDGTNQSVRVLNSIGPINTTTFAPTGGTITNNGSQLATFTDESNGNTVFGGSITDGSAQTALTIDAATYSSNAVFTGANTYTGATTIAPMGVLEIGAEAALYYGFNPSNYVYGSLSATTPISIAQGNTGATSANADYPGTLVVALANNYTLPNTITGAGRLYFEGTGTTTVSGTSSFGGTTGVITGTTVLDFSQSTSPNAGVGGAANANVLYNGVTYAITNGVTLSGVAVTGSSNTQEQLTLGNNYTLNPSATTGTYIPIVAGDYIYANGLTAEILSVNTTNNTFVVQGTPNARTLTSAVILAPTVPIVQTASVTSGATTISGIDTTNLTPNQILVITDGGVSQLETVKTITTTSTTAGVITLGSAITGATGAATLDFSNAAEDGLYMGELLGSQSLLLPTATATNPGGANLDIQGGNGGTSTQTIGQLSLSGISAGTGIGGANGSAGGAANITLIPGTNGNIVTLNIGVLGGGAGGGDALNFTLPTTTGITTGTSANPLATTAVVTIADPAFDNSGGNGNYTLPYLNGRQLVTINNDDYAAVNTLTGQVYALSSLSNTVATTASNYFQYAYTAITPSFSGTAPTDASNGVGDVLTAGTTATFTSGGANAFRFNEAYSDTLTFNQVSPTSFLGSASPLSNILVTANVGAHTSDINGSPLYFSNGIGGNRVTEIDQSNTLGILEIDNDLSYTSSSIAKVGQGTLLFTGENGNGTGLTIEQGTVAFTGNAVAPSYALATTISNSNVITFSTPFAAGTYYVGEYLNTGTGAGTFITKVDPSGNYVDISANYGTTNSTAVSLNFVGGSGLGSSAMGIGIDYGATLQYGSGTLTPLVEGSAATAASITGPDNVDGSLLANQSIGDNGTLLIALTGTGNAGTNFNTINNAISGIGQLVLATPASGTMTTTLEGNNSYAGGTVINANTTLVVHSATAGTATGAFTLGSNLVTLSSTAGLAVGQTITSNDLGTSGASGTSTILAINSTANTITLSSAATGTATGVSITTAAYGANALPVGGNRDGTYGSTGLAPGYGVTINSGGTLDLGGYTLNTGSTTVPVYSAGYLDLNGGTIQDGSLGVYFGAELYSGTETATTQISDLYQYYQGLTKLGSGTVYLNGLNTFVSTSTSASYSPVTISGGILNFATNGNTNNFNGGAASGLGANPNAAVNLVLDGGTLQYTGTTVVNTGTTTGAPSTTNPLTNINGTATAVQTTDRLFSITQNGGTIDSSAAYAIQFTNTGSDLSSGTGNRTLTLTGSQVASTTYGTSSIASILADASTGNTLAVSKTGAGTWALNGANTYTGGTTVTGGALLINNTTGSGTGTGAVTVQNGGTFGGGATTGVTAKTYGASSPGPYQATRTNYTAGKNGISTGAVEVQSGGILQPGDAGAVGTLTLGTLTLDAGSALVYDFNSTSNSLVAVTASGGLTLASGTGVITLDVFAAGTTNPYNTIGVYNIFSYAGSTFNGNLTALTANLSPGTYTFANDTADSVIQLDITSAPEPKVWAMLLGGLGLLVAIRRARSRSSVN